MEFRQVVLKDTRVDELSTMSQDDMLEASFRVALLQEHDLPIGHSFDPNYVGWRDLDAAYYQFSN